MNKEVVFTLKTISYDCSFSSSTFSSPFDILDKSDGTFIRKFTDTRRSRYPRSVGRYSKFRVRAWNKYGNRSRNPRFPVLRVRPWDNYEYRSRNLHNIGRFPVSRIGLLDKYDNRGAHQKSLELDKKGIIQRYAVESSFDERYVRRESRTDHVLKYNCQPRKPILSRHSKIQLKRDP